MVAQETDQAQGAFERETGESHALENREPGIGGDEVDDRVEGFLLTRISQFRKDVVEGEAALPAGEAATGDAATPELEAQGVAVGKGVGAHHESGFGVEGGHWIGTDGFAGTLQGNDRAQAGVLFEVRQGDLVDILVWQAGGWWQRKWPTEWR